MYIKNEKEIINYISSLVNNRLELGEKVLWFISGGSCIPIEVSIAKKINIPKNGELVITLTDERYDKVGHADSNWSQLEKSGFKINSAKMIKYLNGKDIINTTKNIEETIKKEMSKASYRIGLFGIGADGHTAGILPNSEALKSKKIIYSYDAHPYKRITITEKVIGKIDEAFVYATGESKWPIIKNLKNDVIKTKIQPAQILKKVPILTIFTDSEI
jgi:6-phosphogluconolactonase/glucosamine-6-phosphate isomerase/deaminase